MGDNEVSMFAVTCKRHVVSFISAEFKIQSHVYAFRCNIICNLHNDKQYTMYSISQALCNIVQHYCHKRGLASWLKCKDHCFPPCEENILLHLYSEHLVVNIGIITKVYGNTPVGKIRGCNQTSHTKMTLNSGPFTSG